jgi:transposase
VAADRASQKAVFTFSIAAHGNVRRAMREAGLNSPVTAYRWLDLYRQHGPDWFTRPPRKTRSVAYEIVDQIVQVSEQHPHWGKARIARELANRYGTPVVSGNGVQSVMREAGLWLPVSPTGGSPPGFPVDQNRLLAAVRHGIRLDLFGEPRRAAEILDRELWQPLMHDPTGVRALLREPELGSWLQRGLLQLGHALIDAGRWRSAHVRLVMLDQWLEDDDSLPPARQRSYQEQGRWYAVVGGDAWRVSQIDLSVDSPVPLESVSLRQADVWLETQQYLALVLRERPGVESVERLAAASLAIDRGEPWHISPERRQHYQGVISHDLAAAQLRSGWALPTIQNHLDRAIDDLLASRNVGMAASAFAHGAQLHGLAARREPRRATLHVDRAQQACDRALELVARDPSPVLKANIWTRVTRTMLEFRDVTVEDRARIEATANLAIASGLGHRARRLLQDPGLRLLLDDYVTELERVASL